MIIIDILYVNSQPLVVLLLPIVITRTTLIMGYKNYISI